MLIPPYSTAVSISFKATNSLIHNSFHPLDNGGLQLMTLGKPLVKTSLIVIHLGLELLSGDVDMFDFYLEILSSGE